MPDQTDIVSLMTQEPVTTDKLASDLVQQFLLQPAPKPSMNDFDFPEHSTREEETPHSWQRLIRASDIGPRAHIMGVSENSPEHTNAFAQALADYAYHLVEKNNPQESKIGSDGASESNAKFRGLLFRKSTSEQDGKADLRMNLENAAVPMLRRHRARQFVRAMDNFFKQHCDQQISL